MGKQKNNIRQKNQRALMLLVVIAFAGLSFLILNPKKASSGTIKIYDRNNILLYEASNDLGKKEYIPIEKIPDYVIKAIIATEDKRFYEHHGVDFKAIARAISQNIKSGEIVSGGSTITQQYARLTYPSLNTGARISYFRKAREILIALKIELTNSKSQILEEYLNNVYFGENAYGIKTAAKTYFNTSAEQLSLAQAAMLVGIIANPQKYNPIKNPENAVKRQQYILEKLKNDNVITEEEFNLALKEPLNYYKTEDFIKAPHFVNYILDEVDKLGINTQNGLKIYTTLEAYLYDEVLKLAQTQIDQIKNTHNVNNAAVVIIDNNTREIVVMMGGIDYFNQETAGQVNAATSLRQPGSAIKPITYLAAFLNGYTPATLIFDVPTQYKTKKGDGFIPNNYDGMSHGLVLAREALASSYNLPAVEMLNRIGLETFLETARKLGITTFNRIDEYDLAITLGGGEVSLLELTNAYSTIAKGGNYKTPVSITKIETDNGRKLFTQNNDKALQTLGEQGEEATYLITDILSDPYARLPTFGANSALGTKFPSAVKTGTTTDWHDNWTVGYTPQYTVGVWVGNNDNSPMRDISGVTGAAPLWNKVITLINNEKQENFVKPENIVEIGICKGDGLIQTELCQSKYVEKFIAGTEPTQHSTAYKSVKIDTRNGLLAGQNCPSEYTEEKILIDYPPQVYTWALSNRKNLIPQTYSTYCNEGLVGNKQNNAFVEIITPKNNAVFSEIEGLSAQNAIVFEVNTSQNIKKVNWMINGQNICQEVSIPYKCKWIPIPGEFSLTATAYTVDNMAIPSESVQFKVQTDADTAN